ncbi:MAG TPA: hypothetical protein VFA70_10800 [Dehalococcoidia bacterium]|nr:hypothetical protein [Dehalococcoidia bacterium]
MATTSIDEAERMRRFPGIEFVDGPTGRRAHFPGTMDLREVVQAFRLCNGNREFMLRNFELTPEQIETALAYYAAYPDEIDAYFDQQRRGAEFLDKYAPLVPDGSGAWRSLKTGETGLNFPD